MGILYRNLRQRVPDDIYQYGRKVVDIANADAQTATITFDDGQQANFDLVVCADGYRSLGRTVVSPTAMLDYRGYVLWRCVLKEDQLATIDPIANHLARMSYDEGHAVFYLYQAKMARLNRENDG